MNPHYNESLNNLKVYTMSKKTSSKTQKDNRGIYKLDNRAKANKIAKLERHVKSSPNDQQSVAALAKLEKSGYTGRTKPLRNKSRIVGTISLQTLDGRLSSGGKLYQQLLKVKKAAENAFEHKSKAEREFIRQIKAKYHEEKYQEEKRKAKQVHRRQKRKSKATATA